MKIPPIDNFIREGFSQQITKQFRCPAIFVSSVDKLRNLQALQGNAPPKYPYIFLGVQSIAPNPESYNTNRIARQGIPVALNTDNNQYQLARLIPVNFEVEVAFTTNKYSGEDTDSVEGFTRRWLFARRIGSLNFNIDYGLSQISVSYALNDSISIAPRENPTEQESVYVVTNTATIHGYVSEPELGTRGRINEIVLTEEHPLNAMSASQFLPF
jgi:hypothetical protein